MKAVKKKKEIFSNSTSIVGSLPLLLVCLFLSTAIFFLCLFFICSCSWNLGFDCSFSCYSEQFASAWWCSCSCFMLAVTVHLGCVSFLYTHDQFPLGRAHSQQVVFRWWFMSLTGSFWSPQVTCKDVAGRPSVSSGRATCLIFAPPPSPSSSPKIHAHCEMWKKIILCEKKPPSAPFLVFPPVVGGLKED